MSNKPQPQSKQQSPTSSLPQKSSQKKQQSKQKSIISSKKKSQRQQKSIGNNNSGRSSQSSSSLKQQEVMEQAIQKASCLIELLTRENSEFRQMIGDLEAQLVEEKESHCNLKQSYDNLLQQTSTINDLKAEIQMLTQQNTMLTKQNQSLMIELQKNRILNKQHQQAKQALTESKQKTKQLHMKIAHLTKSTTQLTSSLNQFKIQHLSLQNENQYLLRELQKHTQKQNVFSANITQKQTQFNTKLSTLDKAKDAFARRTHELQQQNLTLIIQIEQLRKDKIDLQIITQQTMHTLDLLTSKVQTYKLMEQKINQIYQKVQVQEKQAMNEKYARSSMVMGYHQDVSTNQKLYQIEQVVNYRLQQLQTMLQQVVTQVMGEKDYIGNLNHIRETQLTVQKLNDYLNQMSKSPPIIAAKRLV